MGLLSFKMAYNVYDGMTDTKILACRTCTYFDSLYEHKLTQRYTYSFAIEHLAFFSVYSCDVLVHT